MAPILQMGLAARPSDGRFNPQTLCGCRAFQLVPALLMMVHVPILDGEPQHDCNIFALSHEKATPAAAFRNTLSGAKIPSSALSNFDSLGEIKKHQVLQLTFSRCLFCPVKGLWVPLCLAYVIALDHH